MSKPEKKTPKTGTTHVLFVTDMSGSMASRADDVRGGFNSYLDELGQDSDAEYRLTVTVFDTRFISLCVDTALADVPRLDGDNYRPLGLTALLDAVGKTVTEFDARVTKLRKRDRVLVVVQTDGAENASREFSTQQIRDLIGQREATGQWSFVYLGAGQAAWGQAAGLGFDRRTTIHAGDGAEAYAASYAGLAGASRSFAKGATGAEAADIVTKALGGDLA